MNFDWFKTFFGMRRVDTIDNRAGNTHPSFKQIVDNAIDDFMTKEPNGLFEKTHEIIHILFNLFIEEDGSLNEPLIIDHRTTILGIPTDRNYVSKYKEMLHKDPPTAGIYERVFYIKELNLITYNEGGTHRLAALNLFYRNERPAFMMGSRKLILCTIDTERLKRYNLHKNNKTLYYIDPSNPLYSINRTELTPLMYDMIINLQMQYFGKANLIDKKQEKRIYEIWEHREKCPIERARELLNKY